MRIQREKAESPHACDACNGYTDEGEYLWALVAEDGDYGNGAGCTPECAAKLLTQYEQWPEPSPTTES